MILYLDMYILTDQNDFDAQNFALKIIIFHLGLVSNIAK